jgi:flagellar basal body-associated protein FliL
MDEQTETIVTQGEVISGEPPKKRNTTLWIVIIVILIVLCCCCALVAGVFWYFWTYGDAIFNMQAVAPLLIV